MSETNNEKAIANQNESDARKERFEFVLSINDSIVCQRYFRINGYRREAASSIDLVDAVDTCVEMIDYDLRMKTKDYLMLTSPLVFKTKDDAMEWAEEHAGEYPDIVKSVLLEDSDETFSWDGEKMTPCGISFSRTDYIPDKSEPAKTLKFAFLDNGREVCSRIWDASVYPRFVRTNIDLTNSRNRYESEDAKYPSLDKYVVDEFNRNRRDLIPKIVHELCIACSKKDAENYETEVTYGDTTYNLNTYKAYDNYMRKWESSVKRKTQKYYQGL